MADEGCGIGILAMGASLPDRVRKNDEWGPFVDAEPGVDPYRGSHERRVLEPERDAVDLEVAACRDALAFERRSPDAVRLLVGSSQTPRYLGPANHGPVAHGLALAQNTVAMTIDSACASFVTQVEVVRALLKSSGDLALIYQSSVISRTMDYARAISLSVGDGAVAQLIGRVDPGLGLIGIEQSIRPELCEGLVMASTDGRRRWTDPSGPASTFFVDAKDVDAARTMVRKSGEYAAETCGLLLGRHGYRASDVDFFVCTQPASSFASMCAEAIGIRDGRLLRPDEHFERFGHLMQASAPLNLFLAWQSGRIRIGDLVLVYTQGAGFIQAAALLRWSARGPDPVHPGSAGAR
jgi:3-oxoacyl-[acyl-carrier-protein] synthase III